MERESETGLRLGVMEGEVRKAFCVGLWKDKTEFSLDKWESLKEIFPMLVSLAFRVADMWEIKLYPGQWPLHV